MYELTIRTEIENTRWYKKTAELNGGMRAKKLWGGIGRISSDEMNHYLNQIVEALTKTPFKDEYRNLLKLFNVARDAWNSYHVNRKISIDPPDRNPDSLVKRIREYKIKTELPNIEHLNLDIEEMVKKYQP